VNQDVSTYTSSPETLLQLAPGVRMRLDAAGHVLVDAPDGTIIDLGPKEYATLSLFSRPLALGHAIDRLEAGERSSTDFLPTQRHQHVDPGDRAPSGSQTPPLNGRWRSPHDRRLPIGRLGVRTVQAPHLGCLG
jgi:hypothetical protein